MVFNRRSDPVPPDVKAPLLRRPERPAVGPAGGAPLAPPIGPPVGNVTPMLGHNAGLADQSVIGSDLTIEGQTITIRCKGMLKINGNIQADLHSRQLEVGREAIISGAIAADIVDVFGRVNGAIYGQKVNLHSSAEVEGDIHSQYLSIEQGAAFDGRSRRVLDPSEIAPQLESTTAGQAAAPRPAPGSMASPVPTSYQPQMMTPPQPPSALDRFTGAMPPQTGQ